MADGPNPVLLSFVKHLPEESVVKKLVKSGAPFREISEQASLEWKQIAPVVSSDAPPTPDLVRMGYEAWYKDADAEDRTRMLGWLNMLGEMALDLAEEEEEELAEEDG
ncbi:MAG: hypothetical protein KC553_04630 [Nitrospina sp.]|nr:hypothetical protein [Nitrospina sp.]